MHFPTSVLGKLVPFLRQSGAFLTVGIAGFLIDAGVYNALVFWGDRGPMFGQPLAAKVIAILAATVLTYFGNRFWTFAARPPASRAKQYLLYALFNVVAIALQLACLGFTRYVLHFATPFSDNLSGTFVGQAIAVVFRYWAYDKFVFAREEAAVQTAPDGRR